MTENQRWFLPFRTSTNYSFIPELEHHGKKYRCEMTNDWISGMVFYSDLISIQLFTGKYYAISSGNWKDPNIWSFTAGGGAANNFPKEEDTAMIDGFNINVTDGVICKEINIGNTPKGKLEVSGAEASLVVNGTINVVAPASPAIKMLIVTNGGKIELR